MCNGSVQYPAPSAQEQALEQAQLQEITDQAAQQKLLQPILLKQAGLQPVYGADGKTITGYEQIPDANADLAKGVQTALLQREQQALAGTLPVDPMLTKTLDDQEAVLRTTMLKQLGPGWETSTPGQKALQNFNTNKAALIASVNRGEITSDNAMSIATGQSNLARQTAQTNAAVNALNFPYSGISQYNTPIDRLWNQQVGAYNAQASQNAAQQAAYATLGGGLLGAAGRVAGSLPWKDILGYGTTSSGGSNGPTAPTSGGIATTISGGYTNPYYPDVTTGTSWDNAFNYDASVFPAATNSGIASPYLSTEDLQTLLSFPETSAPTAGAGVLSPAGDAGSTSWSGITDALGTGVSTIGSGLGYLGSALDVYNLATNPNPQTGGKVAQDIVGGVGSYLSASAPAAAGGTIAAAAPIGLEAAQGLGTAGGTAAATGAGAAGAATGASVGLALQALPLVGNLVGAAIMIAEEEKNKLSEADARKLSSAKQIQTIYDAGGWNSLDASLNKAMADLQALGPSAFQPTTVSTSEGEGQHSGTTGIGWQFSPEANKIMLAHPEIQALGGLVGLNDPRLSPNGELTQNLNQVLGGTFDQATQLNDYLMGLSKTPAYQYFHGPGGMLSQTPSQVKSWAGTNVIPASRQSEGEGQSSAIGPATLSPEQKAAMTPEQQATLLGLLTPAYSYEANS